jgi:uncharacterized protein YkwD
VTAERVLASLAPLAIALILSSLVLAAFTLGRTSSTHPLDARTALIVRPEERAAPIARFVVRDVAPPAVLEASAAGLEDVAAEAASVPEPAPAAAEPTAAPTPVPTPAPTPRPTPATIRTTAPAPIVSVPAVAAEQQMLALMNASRASGGLIPLALDPTVSGVARAHSEVESRYGYVYHDGPDGSARSRDAAACGTGWYGENTGKAWQGHVDRLHLEFMSEPWAPINHRTNIMDPAFRRVGIGAAQGNDALYMTMVFCR